MAHFFALRREIAATPETIDELRLSHPAREVLHQLHRWGACFFEDLVRITRRLPVEVEEGLWELVAGGLVTADGFDNLRALVDPKRRRGERGHRSRRPRHALGRWASLPGVTSSEDREVDASPQGCGRKRQIRFTQPVWSHWLASFCSVGEWFSGICCQERAWCRPGATC